MSEDRQLVDNERAARQQLFAEFDPPTQEAWREETVASLQGRPIEKLVSRTYEGIDLQPIYRRSDAADIAHQQTLPGLAPFVRGAHTLGYLVRPWLVAQAMKNGSPAACNQTLRADLSRGQTAINLVVAGPGSDGIPICTSREMGTIFEGINLAETPILLSPGDEALALTALLSATAATESVPLTSLKGSIGGDPLRQLVKNGTIPIPLAQAHAEMALLTGWAAANAPGLDTISIDSSPYHDGGANAVQELAYAMATGVAYLRAMVEHGLAIETVADKVAFTFSVGGNYFMEIAKLRAARLLWSQVVAAFGGSDDAKRMTLHVRTAIANKTKTDPYVNMLRATTEAFAGAVGGVDSMDVAPFDDAIRPADQFSRRIARNVQLVLQSEANMDRIIDPVGGSWYVECLTDQLGKEAWTHFQEIERVGGMVEALKVGLPQAEVAATAAKRAANLATRRDVLVGTNMYANLSERALEGRPSSADAVNDPPIDDDPAPTAPLAALTTAPVEEKMAAAIAAAAAGATVEQISFALRGSQVATSIRPIPIQRLGEPYEALRAAANRYTGRVGHAPQLFLANMGPVAQHKVRADFVTGFLAVGGFDCHYPAGFGTSAEAVDAALASGMQVVVICSTDERYPEVVPPVVQGIKSGNPDILVLVAGYPTAQVDAFKAAGVDEFIHIRANCYAINASLQTHLGIT